MLSAPAREHPHMADMLFSMLLVSDYCYINIITDIAIWRKGNAGIIQVSLPPFWV